MSSEEGTTQGHPLTMQWYSINTTITIDHLRNITEITQVWLADDSATGGKIIKLYNHYTELFIEGRKHDYLVNGNNSWLIVKSKKLHNEAEEIFQGKMNISLEGKWHLGAIIGSKDYKNEYCNEKVSKTMPSSKYTASRGIHCIYKRETVQCLPTSWEPHWILKIIRSQLKKYFITI